MQKFLRETNHDTSDLSIRNKISNIIDVKMNEIIKYEVNESWNKI